MFWLRFPALLLLPTEANTIVLKLKSLMKKCLFQWNFQDETQTDPESHTDLKLSSPKTQLQQDCSSDHIRMTDLSSKIL